MAMAAKYIDTDWRAYSVAETPTVRAFHGMTVVADHTFEDAPKPGMICVPGGNGTPGHDARAPAVVHQAHRGGGAARHVGLHRRVPLHATGFLEGKRATTYWGAKKETRELGGNVEGRR